MCRTTSVLGPKPVAGWQWEPTVPCSQTHGPGCRRLRILSSLAGLLLVAASNSRNKSRRQKRFYFFFLTIFSIKFRVFFPSSSLGRRRRAPQHLPAQGEPHSVSPKPFSILPVPQLPPRRGSAQRGTGAAGFLRLPAPRDAGSGVVHRAAGGPVGLGAWVRGSLTPRGGRRREGECRWFVCFETGRKLRRENTLAGYF